MKLELDVHGNSDVVWVYTLPKGCISNLPNADDREDFDWLDFLEQHTVDSYLVCHGLNQEGDLEVRVKIDGDDIYHGEIHDVDFDPDAPADQIIEETREYFGVDLNEVVHRNMAVDEHLLDAESVYPFGDISPDQFVVIERVAGLSATGRLDMDVDDDFELHKLSAAVIDIDSGAEGSVMQRIYQMTGLETEVTGFFYKGALHKLEVGTYEGGASEWTYLEYEDGHWLRALTFEEKLNALAD